MAETNGTPSPVEGEENLIVVDTGEGLRAPQYPSRAITYSAFRKRFTFEERTAMESAKQAPTNATDEQIATAASVRVIQADAAATAATWLDLADPDVLQSLTFFESIGLLAEGRAHEIVDIEPADHERPIRRV